MAYLKKIFSIILRVGISVILLYFIFRQVDEKSMFRIMKNADLGFLFSAFMLFFLSYVLCFFRWNMLLKAAGMRLPIKRVFFSFCGGVFFNLFLPSTIGGDFMRSVDLGGHTGKTREVVATVFLDRLSGYIGMVILALIALGIGWNMVEDYSVILSMSIITSLLVISLLVLFNNFFYSKINAFFNSPTAGRIKDILGDVHDEIYIVRNQKKMIVKNLAISFLSQAVSPVSFYLIALSFGIKANFIYFLIFLPIIGAITLLPISIGGLGLRDASMIYFFAKAGVVKDMAFAISLTSFLFIIICGALGGMIYVFTVHHRRVQPD